MELRVFLNQVIRLNALQWTCSYFTSYNVWMSQEFNAIYEHGILRPLAPLNLPESTEVILTIRNKTGNTEELIPGDPLLGLMANEPELVDEVIAGAMSARESYPLRTQS